MSADNGVYVLVTRGRKTQRGRKTEYRVVHAQSIENIFTEPNYPDFMVQDSALNREMVLEYFGNARVFTDRRVAEGYAQAMYDMWSKDFYVEYGIVWFEYACIPFPRQQHSQRSSLSAVG